LKENKINYISKNDLAKSLGVSLSTISRKLTELQGIKLGNARQSRVLFQVDKVNDYLESLSFAKKKRAD
jgi:biotin operon repressor|tara:strand:- start:89 stop:295 length:207 start_codon:yes stop_codon:yes gene_type:complete